MKSACTCNKFGYLQAVNWLLGIHNVLYALFSGYIYKNSSDCDNTQCVETT